MTGAWDDRRGLGVEYSSYAPCNLIPMPCLKRGIAQVARSPPSLWRSSPPPGVVAVSIAVGAPGAEPALTATASTRKNCEANKLESTT